MRRLSYLGRLDCRLRLLLTFAIIRQLNGIGLGITFWEYIKVITEGKATENNQVTLVFKFMESA